MVRTFALSADLIGIAGPILKEIYRRNNESAQEFLNVQLNELKKDKNRL